MPVLEVPGGRVRIEPLAGAQRRVTLEPNDPHAYLAPACCDTTYPDDLIAIISRTKGFGAICEEILRENSDGKARKSLQLSLLSYVPPEWFAGKTVLDVGCGMGASSMILSQMFPQARIYGAELEPALLEVARARRAHYGAENVTLALSPDGCSLPPEPASCDAVVMCALYEHLLPDERRALMPRIWERLRPGGILFLTETPHRWHVMESHTTWLPLVNYMPDWLALWVARRFTKRFDRTSSWGHLLREGIRGGSVTEIRRLLPGSTLLEPTRGVRDRIELWFEQWGYGGTPLKRAMRVAFRLLRATTGVTFQPALAIALRKGR